jgi:ubiquinone/menaquinone biosynthesis C-methylase UbiE
MAEPAVQGVSREAEAGAAVYSRPVLWIYDAFVLGFSNRMVWKCPTPGILRFYNAHISGNHLDVGVGTGYFLDKCKFPTAAPQIALLDLNPNSLAATEERLRRYSPTAYQGDVLQPLDLDGRTFDSIGVNYLLHCLPGPPQNKKKVFDHLKAVLNPGGCIFGTTILGTGVPHGWLARRFLKVYNKKQIFGNREDSLAGLEGLLRERFRDYDLKLQGCVAFFKGTV